jgi:hypothetical protein
MIDNDPIRGGRLSVRLPMNSVHQVYKNAILDLLGFHEEHVSADLYGLGSAVSVLTPPKVGEAAPSDHITHLSRIAVRFEGQGALEADDVSPLGDAPTNALSPLSEIYAKALRGLLAGSEQRAARAARVEPTRPVNPAVAPKRQERQVAAPAQSTTADVASSVSAERGPIEGQTHAPVRSGRQKPD